MANPKPKKPTFYVTQLEPGADVPGEPLEGVDTCLLTNDQIDTPAGSLALDVFFYRTMEQAGVDLYKLNYSAQMAVAHGRQIIGKHSGIRFYRLFVAERAAAVTLGAKEISKKHLVTKLSWKQIKAFEQSAGTLPKKETHKPMPTKNTIKLLDVATEGSATPPDTKWASVPDGALAAIGALTPQTDGTYLLTYGTPSRQYSFPSAEDAVTTVRQNLAGVKAGKALDATKSVNASIVLGEELTKVSGTPVAEDEEESALTNDQLADQIAEAMEAVIQKEEAQEVTVTPVKAPKTVPGAGQKPTSNTVARLAKAGVEDVEAFLTGWEAYQGMAVEQGTHTAGWVSKVTRADAWCTFTPVTAGAKPLRRSLLKLKREAA